VNVAARARISGSTRVLFILADPVAHVRTPQAINALAQRYAADCVMVPCEVAAADLGTVVGALRAMKSVDGAVVTMPHKLAAAELCDELGITARAAGVVNAIRRTPDGKLRGEVFDGLGFVAALRGSGFDPHGARVFLMGAGGAACAIAFALAQNGVRRLAVCNRTGSKAQRLASMLTFRFPEVEVLISGTPNPAGSDLVVNASTLGRNPQDELPLDVQYLDKNMRVADVVMSATPTPLLLAAQSRGCITQSGQAMLEGQLPLIAQFLGIARVNESVSPS
jgi:shikimate dehydrogenase